MGRKTFTHSDFMISKKWEKNKIRYVFLIFFFSSFSHFFEIMKSQCVKVFLPICQKFKRGTSGKSPLDTWQMTGGAQLAESSMSWLRETVSLSASIVSMRETLSLSVLLPILSISWQPKRLGHKAFLCLDVVSVRSREKNPADGLLILVWYLRHGIYHSQFRFWNKIIHKIQL